jgi:hypothetical protein
VTKAVVAALMVVVVAALAVPFGYVRAGVAVAMSAAIFLAGVRYYSSIVAAPPEPEVADVSEYGLKYVCTMCGLELRVEKAARDKAPTHCMEAMVLVREDGRPPLHPV